MGGCWQLSIAFRHARCNLCLHRVSSTVNGSGAPKQTGHESDPSLSTTFTYWDITSDVTSPERKARITFKQYLFCVRVQVCVCVCVIRTRTENGVLERVVAAHAAIQQIHRILVAQVRGHGVDARPATAFGAAGIRIEHDVPGLPFLTGFDVRCRRVVLDAVLAAEYVKVAEDDARDVRRPVRVHVPAFPLQERKLSVRIVSSSADERNGNDMRHNGIVRSHTRQETHFLVALLRATVRRFFMRDLDGGALNRDRCGSFNGSDLELFQCNLHQRIRRLLDASYRPHIARAASHLRQVTEVDDIWKAQVRLGDVDGLVALRKNSQLRIVKQRRTREMVCRGSSTYSRPCLLYEALHLHVIGVPVVRVTRPFPLGAFAGWRARQIEFPSHIVRLVAVLAALRLGFQVDVVPVRRADVFIKYEKP